MIESGAHLCDFQCCACIIGIKQHLSGNRVRINGAVVGAVAKLTMPVVSPCPGVSLLVNCQRMIKSSAHLCGLQCCACIIGIKQHLSGNRTRLVLAVVCVVAELTI